MSKFHIDMEDKGKLAEISVEVDAAANDVANMFHYIATQHPEIVQCILDGLLYKEEDVTIN